MRSTRSFAALWVVLACAGCASGSAGSPDAVPDATPDVPLADVTPDVPAADAPPDAVVQGPWAQAPVGAIEVSDSELEAFRASGTLLAFGPDRQALADAARAQQAVEDAATLKEIYAKRPELQARLEAPPSPDVTVLADGNYQILVADGKGGKQAVVTQGGQTRIHDIVDSYRRFHTIDNQVAIYTTVFPLIPDDCAVGLPDPSTVGSMDLAALEALNKQVATCWEGVSQDLGDSGDGAPVITDPSQFEGAVPEPSSGYAGDHYGSGCTHEPEGLYMAATWPGKSYDTDVKSQGARGSCVSFGIVAAMENSILRRYGQAVNLSEQSLYATAKLFWSPDDANDGLPLTSIVADMILAGFAVPLEGVWAYNQAYERIECTDKKPCAGYAAGDPPWFQRSCGYGGDVYQGPACGDTAHQAKVLYHASDHSAYYWTPVPSAKGLYAVDRMAVLFDITDNASANYALMFISQGYSVAMGFDIVASFGNIFNSTDNLGGGGWVGQWNPSDVASEKHDLGSHAVQASGAVVHFVQDRPEFGRRLVIKNSWGQCWGDAGYAYMGFTDLKEVMNGAVAILPKQVASNTAPTVQILSPANGTHVQAGALASTIHFEAKMSDAEDGPGCCAVKWTDSSDPVTVFSTSKAVDQPLTVLGAQTITVTVTDSMGKKATAAVSVTVDDDPPVATIVAPQDGETVYRNTTYVVQGTGTDPNQPLGVPCSKLAWKSSDPGDAINGQTGCEVQTQFTTNGTHRLILTVTDDFGSTAEASVGFTVADAPPKAPPTVSITSPVGTSADPFAVPDPTVSLKMKAAVTSPGGFADCPAGTPDCVSYVWKARYWDTGTFKTIGSVRDLAWTPLTFFTRSCSSDELEVQLCATDPNGTTCKLTYVTLNWPPC